MKYFIKNAGPERLFTSFMGTIAKRRSLVRARRIGPAANSAKGVAIGSKYTPNPFAEKVLSARRTAKANEIRAAMPKIKTPYSEPIRKVVNNPEIRAAVGASAEATAAATASTLKSGIKGSLPIIGKGAKGLHNFNKKVFKTTAIAGGGLYAFNRLTD